MKKFLLLLVAILTFCGCAVLGYTLAKRADQSQNGVPTTASVDGSVVEKKEEQYRLIILSVDQLDNPRPTLLSTWYVSLFFLEDGSPTLTFAQIYPNPKNPQLSALMQQSFALDAQGNPQKGFWQALNVLNLSWDSFLVIDNYSAQKLFEWANGPGNYATLMEAPNEHAQEIEQALKNSCRQVAGMESHPKEGFAWGDIAPSHFHSNLRMEVAMSFWDRLVKSTQAARCEVLLAR